VTVLLPRGLDDPRYAGIDEIGPAAVRDALLSAYGDDVVLVDLLPWAPRGATGAPRSLATAGWWSGTTSWTECAR
jgi:hypothetical protein